MKTVQRQDGAHGDGIWSVAWTNTSNTVVTASVDNTVKTWSGDTLEPVCVCTSRANDTIRRHAMGWDGDACWLLPLRLLCFACGSVWLQSTLLLSVDMYVGVFWSPSVFVLSLAMAVPCHSSQPGAFTSVLQPSACQSAVSSFFTVSQLIG